MGSSAARTRRLIARLAASFLVLILCGSAADAQDCRADLVRFRVPGGTVATFTVETARTAAERAHGLMNRDRLAPDAGMIFVWQAPVHARFWMKDTHIPLDMIFVDPSGIVQRVAADARPMDRTVIDGGLGIQYVVEVNAGRTRALGIHPGAQMQSPLIPASRAAWPCIAR